MGNNPSSESVGFVVGLSMIPAIVCSVGTYCCILRCYFVIKHGTHGQYTACTIIPERSRVIEVDMAPV